MPNGEIERVSACFDIMRCIQVKDEEHLLSIAKLLGINSKKFDQLKVGNIYIAQDCQVQSPAVKAGDDAPNPLMPHPGKPTP